MTNIRLCPRLNCLIVVQSISANLTAVGGSLYGRCSNRVDSVRALNVASDAKYNIRNARAVGVGGGGPLSALEAMDLSSNSARAISETHPFG
ncbi:uncharacterized protein PHALS_10662 [Plasmopara halstedii]|uniref:Uncharacterized protein n=1 Tax=Plasmopara halstedii TaxID=4781 RepID=A0A0P1AI84_PLAHL|nr:uncharacterized protein PHALS_10662 [Plasmopara halstedii]CEG40465.1 hypothetical protein PHALS_10662 [Plasmopara halstedii]|eukprot:XP_024576834.1 hypothetical protein PHALS_10662 [Plasmopara halstedii]